MKRISIYILLLFGVLGLGSCTTQRVHSDYVRGTDFTKYKTFAFLLPTDSSGRTTPLPNDIVNQNLRQFVSKEMTARGLTMDSMQPDLYARITTRFERRTERVSTPAYTGYPNYYPGLYPAPYGYPGYYGGPMITGYDSRTVDFTEGTIIVDIIDRASNNLVWRGWSNEDVYNPEKFEAGLEKRVVQIFKRFPIQPGPAASVPEKKPETVSKL